MSAEDAENDRIAGAIQRDLARISGRRRVDPVERWDATVSPDGSIHLARKVVGMVETQEFPPPRKD